MIFACQKKIKIKKNKALYTKLAILDESRRDAVLCCYFNACKMAFRIKATINYTWNMEKKLDDVVDLLMNDSTFHKMQAMMTQDLTNAFGSFSTDEPVLGEIVEESHNISNSTKPTKKKGKDAAATEAAAEAKIIPTNKYIAVAHLLPAHTEVTEDLVGVIVRNSVVTSMQFLDTIQKIRERDPQTIAFY